MFVCSSHPTNDSFGCDIFQMVRDQRHEIDKMLHQFVEQQTNEMSTKKKKKKTINRTHKIVENNVNHFIPHTQK